MKINENCKLASEWDAENPDENVEHYKAKLNELYEKFKPWIEVRKTPRIQKPRTERWSNSVLFIRS